MFLKAKRSVHLTVEDTPFSVEFLASDGTEVVEMRLHRRSSLERTRHINPERPGDAVDMILDFVHTISAFSPVVLGRRAGTVAKGEALLADELAMAYNCFVFPK